MKLSMDPAGKSRQRVRTRATKPVKRTGEPEAPARAAVPKRLRRLKWYELVRLGDFVADEHQGFALWEGPSGFRADAFVKPIYRRDERRSTATKKVK